MPALYDSPVCEFLTRDDDFIIGRLSSMVGHAHAELAAEQFEAWRRQLVILKSALSFYRARKWYLLLEYPIPRRGKRIDAVLLTERLIIVVEFKCGSRKYERAGQLQVEDYCLDLRDFHFQSRQRILIPILVATEADEQPPPLAAVDQWVAPIWSANRNSLGKVFEEVVKTYELSAADQIDPFRWNAAEYAPTPTIVEAARTLYEGQNVREITRCHAGAENLTKTSRAVLQAIERARQDADKLICFITGVPGSGKTLAGLNIVHNRDLHGGALGVFLSGNGPLVRVLTEALSRDHRLRTGESIAESRRRVMTFVQNVHRFIDAHFTSGSPPPDRVVVFDEAQRAWNREQSMRKFKRDRSEAEIMLDIMDRLTGWAVIVALVGSGQEINTGEAGLSEWGKAIVERFRHWKILVSPQSVKESRAANSDLLFEHRPDGVCITENEALHLEVSLRSFKAQAVSDFVAHLLSHDIERARTCLASCPEFPIVMTRDLGVARNWLTRRQRGTRRIGLIASSGGRRLRAGGLDVRAELDVENWFLNPSSDVRSSYYLEMPATEFGIQGLELDWTGVCWDIDLVPNDSGWQVQAFKGSEWQTVRDTTRRKYVLNKYRVLLTRAREGMIIWVPSGDSKDWTRPAKSYGAVAAYLRSCGVPEI